MWVYSYSYLQRNEGKKLETSHSAQTYPKAIESVFLQPARSAVCRCSIEQEKENNFLFSLHENVCFFKKIAAGKTLALKKSFHSPLPPSVSLSAIIGLSSMSGLVTTMEVRGVTKP